MLGLKAPPGLEIGSYYLSQAGLLHSIVGSAECCQCLFLKPFLVIYVLGMCVAPGIEPRASFMPGKNTVQVELYSQPAVRVLVVLTKRCSCIS